MKYTQKIHWDDALVPLLKEKVSPNMVDLVGLTLGKKDKMLVLSWIRGQALLAVRIAERGLGIHSILNAQDEKSKQARNVKMFYYRTLREESVGEAARLCAASWVLTRNDKKACQLFYNSLWNYMQVKFL
jgi:hypothetical protein